MLKAEFVGHIGSDAEIKNFNGKPFIAFNVATSERYKDARGTTVTRTTWVSCLKPGDGAVVQYLKKGTQVFCRGNLTAKPYTGRNGVERGLIAPLPSWSCSEADRTGRTNSRPNPDSSTAHKLRRWSIRKRLPRRTIPRPRQRKYALLG